jgi:hypothetical protein
MVISKRNRWRRAICDPVFFAREFLEIEPHEGQVKWLTNSIKAENLLHTGNRWGKSLAQAIKILHRCIFKIRNPIYDISGKYNAVNCSITLDQARIIFNNVKRLIKGKPLLELLINCVRYTPHPRIYFGNGAIFSCRSTQRRGEYILGQDYDYICFDECAFDPEFDYVVNEVLLLRLADRAGSIDYVSTPKGKNAFYRKAKELRKNKTYGYVQQGKTEENGFISWEYIMRKKETLPELKVRQNLYGEFVDTGQEFIGEDLINSAIEKASGFEKPMEGKTYVSGWDLARKFTYTVGVTLDITRKPYQLVAFERFRNREWQEVFAAIRRRKKLYGGRVIIDSTGLGDVVLADIADIGPEGFNFGKRGGKAKTELLANLEMFHARGEVAYPYLEQTDGEDEYWSNRMEFQEASWEGEISGDFIMALGLALWPLRGDSEEARSKPVQPRLSRA